MTVKKLSEEQKALLINDLATSPDSQATLATKYGISRATVTVFKKENQTEIEALIEKSVERATGELIKDQEWRMKSREQDMILLGNKRSPEFVRVRELIRHNAAEELGQLPPRMQISIQPVTHIIHGVDLDSAMPAIESYAEAEIVLEGSESNSESLTD